MLRIVSLAVTLAVCVARPNQWDEQLGLFPADGGDSQPILPRAVANPTTPNQILDAVLEGAIAYMDTLGWCDSKNVQNGESSLPFQVNSDGSSSENFSITKANVTGLCSLRRSKSASFNADQSVLTGSVVVENARANADLHGNLCRCWRSSSPDCFWSSCRACGQAVRRYPDQLVKPCASEHRQLQRKIGS
ncbi:uncharacterized protein LOC134788881 [Penaeus indicus]|uniref:uncharacterized protein LOC134788881 n=1 Tax=Penaeus indicus TaxID=29960 RepID=UPI00300D212A